MAKPDKKKASGPRRQERVKTKKRGSSSKKRVTADQTIPSTGVMDRLHAVVNSRRSADPAVSHSARLLSRGPAKVAQKFGEEAVECLIEAVAGNKDAVVAESADVLYHLIVLWVASNVAPSEVWAELERREGVSGIVEKAARAGAVQTVRRLRTTKIP